MCWNGELKLFSPTPVEKTTVSGHSCKFIVNESLGQWIRTLFSCVSHTQTVCFPFLGLVVTVKWLKPTGIMTHCTAATLCFTSGRISAPKRPETRRLVLSSGGSHDSITPLVPGRRAHCAKAAAAQSRLIWL